MADAKKTLASKIRHFVLACAVMSLGFWFSSGNLPFLQQPTASNTKEGALPATGGNSSSIVSSPMQASTTGESVFTATPLPYAEVSVQHIQKSRKNVIVTIVPTINQEYATKQQLAATVMAAAQAYQKQFGVPVVSIILQAQNTQKPYADARLAFCVFIPDGKGLIGNEATPKWHTVMAAARGFTSKELEYLRLWEEMRSSFLVNGSLTTTAETSLDIAISQKMHVTPNTLNPFANIINDVIMD